MSHIGDGGEWEKKSPSKFANLRGIVSSVTHGAHASVPATYCWPYSMLELIAWRLLSHAAILRRLPTIADPEGRFLTALSWYLSTLHKEWEVFKRKPWNPILGECVSCSVADASGKFILIGEQVSHHPPASAFAVFCEELNVEITMHQTFADGNIIDTVLDHHDAPVTVDGRLQIAFNKSEIYDFREGLPPMVIHGSILTEPSAFYTGEVHVECAQTHYSAAIKFTNAAHSNKFTGEVKHQGDTVATIEGACGGLALVRVRGQQHTLFDAATPPARIHWPPTDWDELYSLNVWRHANEAILRGDWSAANEAKAAVEEQQRRRAAAHPAHQARFFQFDAERRVWRPVGRHMGELFKQ